MLATLILPTTVVASTNSSITVGFSPGGTATTAIMSSINNARKSIDVAAFSFTSRSVAEALRNASRRGIKVRVIADAKDSVGKYSAVTWMHRQGISVRVNGQYAIQHNKFMVIDGITIQTGSYNYTSSADKRNAENVIIIHNHRSTAAAYQAEFNRLWQESDEPSDPFIPK